MTPTTAPVGTYDDPIRLDTPYGPLAVWFTAAPSRVELNMSRVALALNEETPSLHAAVRSPECGDDPTADPPTERGYIDGRRAYWPLTINHIPYALDGYFRRDDSGAWGPARDQGYYTRVKRLSPVPGDRAVATFDDEPTNGARTVVHREIEPLILAALATMTEAHEAARERARVDRIDSAAKLREQLAAILAELDAETVAP
jgi:hypothetical protein